MLIGKCLLTRLPEQLNIVSIEFSDVFKFDNDYTQVFTSKLKYPALLVSSSLILNHKSLLAADIAPPLTTCSAYLMRR